VTWPHREDCERAKLGYSPHGKGPCPICTIRIMFMTIITLARCMRG